MNRIKELEDALAVGTDLPSLRKMCHQKLVPEKVRIHLWKVR
jgi:hypothetical protein